MLYLLPVACKGNNSPGDGDDGVSEILDALVGVQSGAPTHLVPKKFLQYPSHRIFEHMHEALNVVEKITNYTV